jgi:putative nucleotidyltransferase with HDIG domain
MESLENQDAMKLITLFSSTIKGISFYPASHPAIRQPLIELGKLIDLALSRVSEVSWGIIDGVMFFDEHLFITPSTALADLANRMLEKRIGRVIISEGLEFSELENFVRLFSVKGAAFDQLSSQFKEEGIRHISLVRQGDEVFITPQMDEVDDGEDEGDLYAAYGQALTAIRGICRDIERGRIPNSASVIRVVDRMVGITMQDPSTLLGLTMIKDYDNYTFNHCVNVGVLSMALGAAIGLDIMSVKSLGIAGQLHDIGKTMIPKLILNKPGKLSNAEFDEMKRHSELGAKIIRDMEGLDPHIGQVVLGHHLHFNRTGYPEWAQKLPFSQLIDIVAIADTYDAITTLRVYQHPVNPRAALSEMQKVAGTFLDSDMVSAFIEMMGKYPVGTLVRLDTNEVAVVYRPNPLDDEAPIVRILIKADGVRLAVPREQPLVEKDGKRYAGIVAVVDPLLKNIDVGKFLVSGNY